MLALRTAEPLVFVRGSVLDLSRFELFRVEAMFREAIERFESRVVWLCIDFEPRGRLAPQAGIRCHVNAELTGDETVVATCTAPSVALASQAAARSLGALLRLRVGALGTSSPSGSESERAPTWEGGRR